MSNENTIYSAPDRAPTTAGREAATIGLAAAAGTAAAAVTMLQMAPDITMTPPEVLELAKTQQLAVSALANVGVTTIVATVANVVRNWLYLRGLG
jgi:hypothetical protein